PRRLSPAAAEKLMRQTKDSIPPKLASTLCYLRFPSVRKDRVRHALRETFVGSQLMAARRALAAVVERGIPFGRHAGSDYREVAAVPRAFVGRTVAAGQVHLSSLFAGREIDFEARFVASKDDRIGSDDRSREEVRPGDDQRVLDKVKLLRRLIQDVAAQVPLEPNHFGESLDQAGWGGLLRVDDCLVSEIDPAAGDLNRLLLACGGIRRL